MGLLIDPSNLNLTITDVLLNTTNVTITDASANGWQANWSLYQAHWYGNQIPPNMFGQALFKFIIAVPLVNADINVTFLVMRVNNDSSIEFENETITFLNDSTSPVLASLNPSNATLANSMQTITANVQENESQLQNVTYTYGACNGTNTTIVLTCNGSICTGTADFTNCNEGNTTWYAFAAANNVGGVTTILGNITFHGIPPNVTAVTPTPGTMYTASEAIYITADVTDDTNVSKVRADVTYPNSTTVPLQLNLATGNKYSKLFNAPNIMGQYNVTIVANDTSGNTNNSQKTNFKIVPDYTFTVALNPSTVRPGRTVVISGTVKLANGSDIPENKTAIDVQGTETNVTLTNGTFSHTFNAPQTIGTYNIYIKVYANSGYNYSSMKKLTVRNPDTGSSGSGWGWDFDDFEGSGGVYIDEDSGVTEAPEEPAETTEDSGVTEAPEQEDAGMIEEEPTPEEVIDEILSKPGNQITGSAVGIGTGTTALAMILLALGLATLAYSNVRIRNHVHKFAKEKVGSKFKKKAPKETGFSDQEWEDYFKRLRED
ncbi:hypothetical protein KY338_01530 [Candidatus Woesearchaeota archaeon]|nr:hypothetical protein [Candidatus Woesearchaeota archaeon]MBW3005595.1 hypothetical protein [Candidatus Woesearchaeota archaeon]